MTLVPCGKAEQAVDRLGGGSPRGGQLGQEWRVVVIKLWKGTWEGRPGPCWVRALEGLDATLRSLDCNLDVRRRNDPCGEDKAAAGPGAASSPCVILPRASIPQERTAGAWDSLTLCGLASDLNPAKVKDLLFPKSLGSFLSHVSASHHGRQPGPPLSPVGTLFSVALGATFLSSPFTSDSSLSLLGASSLSHILEPHMLGSWGVVFL